MFCRAESSNIKVMKKYIVNIIKFKDTLKCKRIISGLISIL